MISAQPVRTARAAGVVPGGGRAHRRRWAVLDPVTEEDLAALAATVRALGAEAVAIDCLFSYLDPSQERAIEAALPAGVFVSRSSEVLPVRREYERASPPGQRVHRTEDRRLLGTARGRAAGHAYRSHAERRGDALLR